MDENPNNNLDERLRILKMVEQGKITANEGASLLGALGEDREKGRSERRVEHQPASGGAKWFRVRVTDVDSGKSKATINIPIGLMDWGLRIGAHFAPEVSDVNMGELREILRSGIEGKIIDVVDEEDGEHVEIFVE